jgi:hypothetical protein
MEKVEKNIEAGIQPIRWASTRFVDRNRKTLLALYSKHIQGIQEKVCRSFED